MINVLSSGPAAVKIIAFPTSGLVPLTVRFIAANTTNAVRLKVDPLGKSSPIFSDDPQIGIPYTYSTPGTYSAKVTVYSENGTSQENTISIGVQSPSELDRKNLREIFNGFLTKLRSKDIDGALKYVSTNSQTKYRGIFDDLKQDLETVVDNIGTLHKGRFGVDNAEYLLLRKFQRGLDAYYLYFIRSEDGIWRIEGM